MFDDPPSLIRAHSVNSCSKSNLGNYVQTLFLRDKLLLHHLDQKKW